MLTYIEENYKYMVNYQDAAQNPIMWKRQGVQCDEGWYPLIKQMIDIISKLDIRKEVNIFQIKEKFGTFRFYFNEQDVSNKYIKEVVDDFTIKINETCEWCGMPGTLVNNEERCKTLCPVCDNMKD